MSNGCNEFSMIWKSKGVRMKTKLRVLNVWVIIFLTYAAADTLDVEKKDNVCFTRILNIRW